jgi:flagellar protein FliO/FliZ
MTPRPPLLSVGAAVLGLLLLAPAALAAGGEATPLNLPADTDVKASGTPGGGGGLVRTIVGLAVVIGVIYGLYWILKQVKAAREDKASGQGLEPLATLPLGGNRSLQLVRAGREIVLVGVAETGVTHVRTYTEAEARQLGLLGDGDAAPLPVPARLGAGGDPFGPQRPGIAGLLEDLRKRTVIRR